MSRTATKRTYSIYIIELSRALNEEGLRGDSSGWSRWCGQEHGRQASGRPPWGAVHRLGQVVAERHGDISEYLNNCGYDTYAHHNIEVYRSLEAEFPVVIALSSGFMTYRDDVHPRYAEIRVSIATASTTFVLLPSLDLKTCVAETIRRQMQRPFELVASHEEEKIRWRFPIFMSLPTRRVETMRPPDEIVAEILNALLPHVTAKD